MLRRKTPSIEVVDRDEEIVAGVVPRDGSRQLIASRRADDNASALDERAICHGEGGWAEESLPHLVDGECGDGVSRRMVTVTTFVVLEIMA